MNKSKVVSHLAAIIRQRFRNAPPKEIEHALMREGWAIGAIREAMDAAA